MVGDMTQASGDSFRYRSDIDGLRAIALLLVVMFHGGFGVDGGYIGVDVFLVISGYVVTASVIQKKCEGGFQIASFFAARVVRLLPAALFMMISTLAIGYFVLLPDQFTQLAESTLANQLGIANILFWRESGYFAESAEIKPLLHTWSLSLEWQFYVLLPLPGPAHTKCLI
jgi:peptidoglycan/LPS O-acetylase OafA/YrhL